MTILLQVSKVLPPSSLILKIWLAWGDEQQNVLFTVKRVRRGVEQTKSGQDQTDTIFVQQRGGTYGYCLLILCLNNK